METKIQVGDCIKAFDFEPCKGRPEYYIVGIVREIGWVRDEYIAYKVECFYDSDERIVASGAKHTRVGQTIYVPVLTSMDYDGRVTKV